jgi:GntR family transcriptional regulator / MocR family aminotransferase
MWRPWSHPGGRDGPDSASSIPSKGLPPAAAAGRGRHRRLGDPAGRPGLRLAIARHIGLARGVQAGAEQVVVTNGTQQGVDLVARVLLA